MGFRLSNSIILNFQAGFPNVESAVLPPRFLAQVSCDAAFQLENVFPIDEHSNSNYLRIEETSTYVKFSSIFQKTDAKSSSVDEVDSNQLQKWLQRHVEFDRR